jgi:hypothetical protein
VADVTGNSELQRFDLFLSGLVTRRQSVHKVCDGFFVVAGFFL